ncbi:MAG: alpha/beta fold hydrolase [Planctomycetes bacterium]|nr:alpha/beta fold hydrolase [Planctomycetota bacterium]
MFLALALVLAAPSPDTAPPPRVIGELIELKTGTGTLYGTIDLPATLGPWPVVLFHAGSGPTDRDGNGPLVSTDCSKQLGRALASQGIAVLRIDKRGIAASAKAMPKEEDVRMESYAADAAAWVARLRKDPRFTKVGFIGHSEGSLVGLIAAREAKFDAFVSLCGPARPYQDGLRDQLKRTLSDDLYKRSDAIIAELAAGRTVKDPPKELAALFRPSVQPFLISQFKYDPAKLAAELKAPLLVVAGSTDIQVPASDAQLFAKANPKAKVVTIDEMNHVLKAAKEGNRLAQLASYYDRSLPLHPKLVPALAEFLKSSLGE